MGEPWLNIFRLTGKLLLVEIKMYAYLEVVLGRSLTKRLEQLVCAGLVSPIDTVRL